ncbi:MAG: elongation factor EF-2 [Candidatus Odinarchaeota archaeon]|nr:elongation factor EF-2 [Candidatus Odinarchaeota archaeon]
MVRIKQPEEVIELVTKGPFETKRIFSIVAHIDHGKTTTTDYLLRRAGLMSFDAAGQVLMTDYDEEEQQRGITIFTSVVNLSYEYNGKNYIFQINDTPGHISFTGEVSRALRASDGAIILVDALEGVMTQTETNIRLAVGEELCKPVLFINKVDRLISELRLQPKEVGQKLDKIVRKVNTLIRKVAPQQFKKEWQVSFQNGTVAIGSAKHGWGFTIDILKEKGINANIIFQKYKEGEIEWLRKNLPLDDALLRMVIHHLPDPKTAQKYRIPKIWTGDINTPEGQALMNCDPNGPLIGMITKIFIHPKTKRPTLIGRIFSGTLKAGEEIYFVNQKSTVRIRRLGVMEITDLLDVEEIPAGNLFAIYGVLCPAGETFIRPGANIPVFEKIKYVAEPVVSRKIEPVDPQDLARLGEVVKMWVLADPTASFYLDQEARQYILSGIDPLQIEILTKRINEQVPIRVSPPIIVYREVPTKRGTEVHTKSPNTHNKLKLYIEPLSQETIELIKQGKIWAEQDRKERARILREIGWDANEAKNIWDIWGNNILVDLTKGVQRLDRIKSYIIAAWREWCSNATLAQEPAMGVKAVMTDAVVHVDPAHTGMGQIAPMTHAALHISFLTANPKLYEPILKIDIKAPSDMQGAVIKILTQHRGVVTNVIIEEDWVTIQGNIPTAETLGIADEFRSATAGKAFWGYEFLEFRPVPDNMQEKLILEIRKRKGLPTQLPTPKLWERLLYVRT